MKSMRILGLLSLVFTMAYSAGAAQHPNMDRGFAPQKAYEVGDVDSINLFNGGMSVSLPLLPPTQVSSSLSYGLRLVYNSNIWNYKPVMRQVGHWYTLASPNAVPNPDGMLENLHANCGLGWMTGFAWLYSPDSPGSSTIYQHQYIAADGSEHLLYPALHGETPTPNVYYSKDGTYLRLKVNGSTATLEFQDGTMQKFQDRDAPHHRWRLYEIRDPYGNTVSVNTAFWPGTWVDQQWTISDSASAVRGVVVTFDSGGNVLSIQAGAWGYPSTVLTFSYSTANIPRAYKHNDPATSNYVDVKLLSGVQTTDASGAVLQTWSFPQYNTAGTGCGGAAECPGVLQRVAYPTGGTLDWTYGRYRLLLYNEGGGCDPADERCERDREVSDSTGVATRTATAGTVVGSWTYLQDNHMETLGPLGGRVIDETVTKVTSPQLDDTVWHFSSDGASVEDGLAYGLAMTRNQNDGAGHYLSVERFRGAAIVDCSTSLPGCQSSGNLQRSDYVRYEYDLEPGSQIMEEDDALLDQLNRRPASRRTVFHDDLNCPAPSGACWSGEDFYNFDGVGHHRVRITRGNFGAGDVRKDKTNFNPGTGVYKVLPDRSGYDYSADPDPFNDSPGHSFTMWPVGNPWILGTFDYGTQTEGTATAKQTYCFDATTGFLRAKRTLKLSNPSDTDLLAVFTPDSLGNTTTEQYLGGDTQVGALPSTYCQPGSNPRWSPVAGDQFRFQHGYQVGVRNNTRYADGSGNPLGFLVLDLDIDSITGLPYASRDTAGLRTDLSYDALRRLTWSKPQSGAWVRYQYLKNGTCGGPAKVETCTKPNGTATDCVNEAASCSPYSDSLSRSAIQFDGLGRVSAEFTKYTGSLWNQRLTAYDGVGRKASLSEWQPSGTSGSAVKWTTYGYCGDHDWDPLTADVCDPFDRILRITPPDGAAHAINMRYTGDRIVEQKVKVATSGSAESDSITARTSDRQGRLVKVTEPSGTGGANVDTLYAYDVGNRLKQASTSFGVTQNRLFTFDNRGFLVSEQLPEVGAGGNGTVLYSKIDARGHLRRLQDGQHDVAFTYDRAERLTQAAQADANGNPGTPVIKTLEYDTIGGAQQGYSLGKLVRATMNNYPEGATNYPVVESYTYNGVGGRVSDRSTVVDGRTINQSFTWTQLGAPASVVYPNDTGITSDPARTVTFSYTMGFLTGVPSYATSISYHPNLMVNQVVHANGSPGVTVTYAKDDNDMRRPKSITTANASANWSTGNYQYDGTGSVWKIGASEVFAYDKVSRLTSGTIFTQGATRTQTASFDPFGFITNLTTNGSPQNFTAVSGTNHISGSTYDGAGSMLTWGVYSYLWDRLNHLTKVSGSGMTARWHLYTADGERIEERIGALASPTTTVLSARGLDGKVLRVFTKSGGSWTWTKDYVYRDGLQLASVDSGGTKHFHLDHLGTIRRITNASRTVVGTHDYYPFGLEATDPAQDTERMKFTGHERDQQGTPSVQTDDLDYMHARYYNANIGRFLTLDEVRGRLGLPQSQNLFAYALNSPVTHADRAGRCVWDICVGETYLIVTAAVATGVAASAYLQAPSPYHPGLTNAQVLGKTINDLGLFLARRQGRLSPEQEKAKDQDLRARDRQRFREPDPTNAENPTNQERPGSGRELPEDAPGPGNMPDGRSTQAPDDDQLLPPGGGPGSLLPGGGVVPPPPGPPEKPKDQQDEDPKVGGKEGGK